MRSRASIRDLIATATDIKDQLSASILSTNPLIPTRITSRPSLDCSANVIDFGLPECNALSDTKSELDRMLKYVAGKEVA